jgi:DNA-directed RNA polymerase specialized sigma24 family protein
MSDQGWTKDQFAELTAVSRLEATKILPKGSDFQVEDVVAQSLEEFWKLHGAGQVDNPRVLMRTITLRRALKMRDGDDPPPSAQSSGYDGPVEPDALHRAIDAMTPEDRRIAELAYFGDALRSAPAVAAELAVETDTVRARLAVIRRELVDALCGNIRKRQLRPWEGFLGGEPLEA